MFYSTDQHHGLKHNPFNALVIPRPIGWISSISLDGRANLAPYSFFNGVAYTPPQVMFSATGGHAEGGYKDTLENIRATEEFVVNIATWPLREAMNLSSAPAPRQVDEFKLAGVTPTPSKLVRPPKVQESPVHLECRLVQIVPLPTLDSPTQNTVVFGQVLGIHIDDGIIKDGMIDYALLQPIGRLGYFDYVRINEVFSMQRPGWPLAKKK